MSTDIHAYFEIKVDGKWEHYSIPNIQQDYLLFEKLAGVRGDVNNAIVAPRGVPKDMSLTTNLDYKRHSKDAHNPSWITSKEFEKVYDFHVDILRIHPYHLNHTQYGYLFGNSFRGFHENKESYPEEVEDFRMVFWFTC